MRMTSRPCPYPGDGRGIRRACSGRVRRRLLWLAVASIVASDATADDRLVFQVSGRIASSCALERQRVRADLGQLPVSALGAIGSGGPWTRVAFMAVDCLGAARASVTVQASQDARDGRYIATAGTADGVAIELRTSDGRPVVPDGRTPVTFDSVDSGSPLGFEARYVRVGAVQPGDAPATATIRITWE